jgi:hypothetical protein
MGRPGDVARMVKMRACALPVGFDVHSGTAIGFDAPGEPAYRGNGVATRPPTPRAPQSTLHRSDCELHRTVTNAFNFNIPADAPNYVRGTARDYSYG